MTLTLRHLACAAAVATCVVPGPSAQSTITTPRAHLGFSFGDDYQLANYKQIADYWRKLDAESDRMILREIGRTAEGRPHLMAIVTSPANHKSLEKYRDISRRLARAEGLSDSDARTLARQGAETENINRVLYHDWVPQILYNHHQSGPAGTVVWSSPQRDPYNYNLDPLLILGLQALGTHLHQRLASEGKPGATMASGGAYDGWWNGGIRNTGNFHNIIAILTETIGSPTPMRIPLVLQRQLPSRDLPYPIAPQEWRFRQAIEYSISFNRAVIDYAARNREHLLFNIYRMGRRAIDRGSEDSWTPSPTRIQALAEKSGGRGGSAERDAELWAELRQPANRDPRGYIIPSDQADFLTAIKFINALREVNVAVKRATAPFDVGGKRYPAGSFVVMTAQAFRPHVLDMFEPQDHPNVIPYPGAPPTPPYDNAGWTLAYQMGVEFDRILEPFSGPFEPVTEWNVKPPTGRVTVTTSEVSRVMLDFRVNDAYRGVNRLLAAGVRGQLVPGGFYVEGPPSLGAELHKLVGELGVNLTGAPSSAALSGRALRAPRIGLWDQYGGSMESGWTRWILEQFEFAFTRVFAPELDAGNLGAKYDVLVFVNGAIPSGQALSGAGRGGRGATAPEPADVPAEYRPHVGRVTIETTLPRIREFVETGGTAIAIGSSAANLAEYLKLPISNHLVENGAALPRSKYFVPGSVLSAKVDTSHPIAAGMRERTDFFFDNSPVFALAPGAADAGVRSIAAFDGPKPLRSGWAWGQQYLNGGAIAVEAKIGKGAVLLFGPEILQRAQPHGTFKLLFNGIFASVTR